MRPKYWKAEVLLVRCRCCGVAVSRRGMKALLLSDLSITMVSAGSDIDDAVVMTSELSEPKCECKCFLVVCKECGAELGYRVKRPCASCLTSNTNGHRTILTDGAVVTEQQYKESRAGVRTILTWRMVE